MSERKWKHGAGSWAGYIFEGEGEAKRIVATVHRVSRGGRGRHSDPVTLGNARLIAAAPELLHALKGFVGQHDNPLSVREMRTIIRRVERGR